MYLSLLPLFTWLPCFLWLQIVQADGTTEKVGQCTYVATSADGLDFNWRPVTTPGRIVAYQQSDVFGRPAVHGIRPAALTRAYQRVFLHENRVYAVGKQGESLSLNISRPMTTILVVGFRLVVFCALPYQMGLCPANAA